MLHQECSVVGGDSDGWGGGRGIGEVLKRPLDERREGRVVALDAYDGMHALEGAVIGGYALVEKERCGGRCMGEDGDCSVVA